MLPSTGPLEAVRKLNVLQINVLASEEAARQDGDDGDPDVGNKEIGVAVEHGIEPAIGDEPSEQALDHPANAIGDELAVGWSSRRDRNLHVVSTHRRREGSAFLTVGSATL